MTERNRPAAGHHRVDRPAKCVDSEDEEDNRITVLLVDNHLSFLEGMRSRFELRSTQFNVVDAVSSAEEALQAVADLVPDIVLLDLRLPARPRTLEDFEGGLGAIRAIRDLSPTTRIVVLSAYDQRDHVARALQAGAASYIHKNSSSEEIIECVRRTHQGEFWLQPDIARKLLDTLHNSSNASAEEGDSLVNPLTDREHEVLRLIAEGQTNKEIARQLCIAIGTVKKHVSNILDKMEMRSRMEAALFYRAKRAQRAEDGADD